MSVFVFVCAFAKQRTILSVHYQLWNYKSNARNVLIHLQLFSFAGKTHLRSSFFFSRAISCMRAFKSPINEIPDAPVLFAFICNHPYILRHLCRSEKSFRTIWKVNKGEIFIASRGKQWEKHIDEKRDDQAGHQITRSPLWKLTATSFFLPFFTTFSVYFKSHRIFFCSFTLKQSSKSNENNEHDRLICILVIQQICF